VDRHAPGPTRVVIEEKRPVPLEHHYLIGGSSTRCTWSRTATSCRTVRRLLDREEVRYKTYNRRGSGTPSTNGSAAARGHRRVYVPRREEVVEALADEGMLPRLLRLQPGRVRPERRVAHGLGCGSRRTTRPPGSATSPRCAPPGWTRRTCGRSGSTTSSTPSRRGSPRTTRDAPGLQGDGRGAVRAGLVKVVFATETLSLGINMPAKSVVIEDSGSSRRAHEILTPASTRSSPAERVGAASTSSGTDRRLPAAGAVRARGLARLDADVRAHVFLPALLQHGGEPHPQLHREQAHHC